jgi:hypothetical protein
VKKLLLGGWWPENERGIHFNFIFEPRDLWVGVYWDRVTDTVVDNGLRLYVCVIPTFVVLIIFPARR